MARNAGVDDEADMKGCYRKEVIRRVEYEIRNWLGVPPARRQMARLVKRVEEGGPKAIAFVRTLPEEELALLDKAMHEGWKYPQ